VLLARRPAHKRHGGLWEFPGGKLRPGEGRLAGVRRELAEELGVKVVGIGRVLFSQLDPGSTFLMEFVEVEIEGEPQALEHESLTWVEVDELHRYQLAPADLAFVHSPQIPFSPGDAPTGL
jgi:8-oxo-dGTP diphosphatase